MPIINVKEHIPYAHRHHSKRCRCWTLEQVGETITCPNCGAKYMLSKVQSFNKFRCYDCLGGWGSLI